jgi:hypothetical protein
MLDAFSSLSVKLRRRAAAEYIKDKWKQRVSYGTLCKLAVLGGGPPMHKQANGDIYYESSHLDDWCRGRVLAGTYRSTAEMPASYRRPGRGREATALKRLPRVAEGVITSMDEAAKRGLFPPATGEPPESDEAAHD